MQRHVIHPQNEYTLGPLRGGPRSTFHGDALSLSAARQICAVHSGGDLDWVRPGGRV